MQPDTLPNSFSVDRLLTAFYTRTIKTKKKEQLDERVCVSESVIMRVFEEYFEISSLRVFYDPERDDATYKQSQHFNLN